MLDVHPPHASTHTWRDFFVHIITIVIGLLIAIGLEQTVEYLHHRHQAHHAAEALHEESLNNRDLTKIDLTSINEALRLIHLSRASLEQARSTRNMTAFHPLPYVQSTHLLAPVDTAWITMRDSGLLSIVPQLLSDTYWKVDFMAHLTSDHIKDVITRREEVEALLHLHDDPSTLSAEESAQLALAYSRLEEALVQARSSMRAYAIGNELGIAGKEFNDSAFAYNWDPR